MTMNDIVGEQFHEKNSVRVRVSDIVSVVLW